MAYEIEEIKLSQQIFYYLIKNRQLTEESDRLLYKAYVENELVMSLVKSQAQLADSIVERYGHVIYLIPKEDNYFLGFTKQQLKSSLCKSNATDKDYYLSQFVIITLLVEFYDGQGTSSKTREYIKLGELQNLVSERLKEGVLSSAESESSMLSFQDMLEAYEALRSEEKSKMKTTKEGFFHAILSFLQKQDLVKYIEEDEMIQTTEKLDHFMDWNLLNKNNYDRVMKTLGMGAVNEE